MNDCAPFRMALLPARRGRNSWYKNEEEILFYKNDNNNILSDHDYHFYLEIQYVSHLVGLTAE